jgi:hypothetical protein
MRQESERKYFAKVANALDEQIIKNKSPELLRKGPKIERRILNSLRSKNTSVSALPELVGGSNPNTSMVKSTMNLYGASRIPTKLQNKTRHVGQ